MVIKCQPCESLLLKFGDFGTFSDIFRVVEKVSCRMTRPAVPILALSAQSVTVKEKYNSPIHRLMNLLMKQIFKKQSVFKNRKVLN